MDPARLAPRTSSVYVEGPGLGAVVGGERLTRGQSGEGVRGLQALLNRLGVQPPLAEDGLLGPKTEAALAGIQAQLGLPSTGALDGATLLAALVAAGAGATPGRPGGVVCRRAMAWSRCGGVGLRRARRGSTRPAPMGRCPRVSWVVHRRPRIRGDRAGSGRAPRPCRRVRRPLRRGPRRRRPRVPQVLHRRRAVVTWARPAASPIASSIAPRASRAAAATTRGTPTTTATA